MNKAQAILLLALISTALTAFTLPFNTASINKHGTAYSAAPCNANTVLDFSFSSNTVLTLDATTPISNSGASSLRYLDVQSYELIYTMTDGQLVSQSFITGIDKSFVFKFTTGSRNVFVAVPILDSANNGTNIQLQQTVDLSTVTDTAFSSLQSINAGSSTTIALSAFNILNDLTNGKFYEIMGNYGSTSNPTTLLIAKIHYKFPSKNFATSTATNIFDKNQFTADSTQTGDVLCWGSQYNTGFFQTHMRENVPLWTFLLSTLIFWLFLLLSSEVTPEVYQRSFKDNKWTCWSFYSIYWLCHEEWFTRTSRTSLILINFFWQGMVCAAIYYHQGMTSSPAIIIWAGVVAFVASVPIPYVVGNLFFRRIYGIQLEKFQTLKEMHRETNKEKHEEQERSTILKEEHIYGIYYFFYSACIILFIVFGIITVHLIQQFPRDYYHLNFQWLASLGIAFGLDHLIFDPIMTLLFGNSEFYRSRGYYYDAKLGELAREAD